MNKDPKPAALSWTIWNSQNYSWAGCQISTNKLISWKYLSSKNQVFKSQTKGSIKLPTQSRTIFRNQLSAGVILRHLACPNKGGAYTI